MKTLTLMIKPVSSLCNLRCRYCFYADEARNRAQGALGIMDRGTREALLEKAMNDIGEGGMLSVVFQGGEPTLAGADFFREFGAAADRLLPRGARIQYAIQTNGFALEEPLLAVLKQYRYLVGVSLDGCRSLHDENRVDAAGEGSWSRVLGNLRRLQAAGIQTNALCVITGQAARQAPRIYRTLKQLGLGYHQYILCLDPLEGERGKESYSLTPEQYGSFLSDAFDLWYADWRRGEYVSVRTFEDFVFNAMGIPCPGCASSGSCGQYLVVEADGSAYPCDFYALDQWRLGNIRQQSVRELLESEAARRFAGQREPQPAQCRDCPYKALCRGGCYRDWEWVQGRQRNHYCQSYQRFFAHALPRLLEIAQAEQAARHGCAGN